MPQLDGLRALAVAGVLHTHLYMQGRPGRFSLGDLGVRLFFVLSGYLITGILLGYREQAEDSGRPKAFFLKRFYLRRMLRIFPLFYLVILVASLLNISPMRETALWHVAYLSNFLVVLKQRWYGSVSHFWTLAVEEQFYLVWPLLILYLPRRRLAPTILATIGLTLLFRSWGILAGFSEISLKVPTPACLETLGMGALLAFLQRTQPEKLQRWRRPGFYVAVACGSVLRYFVPQSSPLLVNATYLCLATLIAIVIYEASLGIGGSIGRILASRPLTQIGKISYGIYVYHNFMPAAVPAVARRLDLQVPDSPLFQMAFYSLLTLIVASLSWTFFEAPLLRLKDKL